MTNKILVLIKDILEIKEYKKVGITTFLFPLQDYCVGYEKEFTIHDINEVKEENKFILINRILNCDDVDYLKKILRTINAKGIIYEDIAVYQIVKELNLDIELIYYQNHFNSNIATINFWLDKVSSVVICNELTKDEIKNILKNVKKSVVLHVLGYNQAMYSRRLLLTNFCDEFNLEKRNTNTLVEKVSGITFKAIENKYGTVLYYGKIFDGLDLLKEDNVKYFYVNTTFMSLDEVIKILTTKDSVLNTDSGFLDKETIYKLKENK